MGDQVVQPNPSLRDDVNFCYSHHQVEVPGPDTYRVCGECFHVYETTGDLEREWSKEPLSSPRSADAIPFCPLCIHDW